MHSSFPPFPNLSSCPCPSLTYVALLLWNRSFAEMSENSRWAWHEMTKRPSFGIDSKGDVHCTLKKKREEESKQCSFFCLFLRSCVPRTRITESLWILSWTTMHLPLIAARSTAASKAWPGSCLCCSGEPAWAAEHNAQAKTLLSVQVKCQCWKLRTSASAALSPDLAFKAQI